MFCSRAAARFSLLSPPSSSSWCLPIPTNIAASSSRRSDRRPVANVTIGNVDFALSLSPTVVLEDVTLANAAGGSRSQMVTAERVEVEMALMPLFRGEYVAKRFILRGADILLEVDPKGATELDVYRRRRQRGDRRRDGAAAVRPADDRGLRRSPIATAPPARPRPSSSSTSPPGPPARSRCSMSTSTRSSMGSRSGSPARSAG